MDRIDCWDAVRCIDGVGSSGVPGASPLMGSWATATSDAGRDDAGLHTPFHAVPDERGEEGRVYEDGEGGGAAEGGRVGVEEPVSGVGESAACGGDSACVSFSVSVSASAGGRRQPWRGAGKGQFNVM